MIESRFRNLRTSVARDTRAADVAMDGIHREKYLNACHCFHCVRRVYGVLGS